MECVSYFFMFVLLLMITLMEFFSFRLTVVEGFCCSVSNYRRQYSLAPTRALPPRGLGDKGEKIIYFKGAKILIFRINIREQGILLAVRVETKNQGVRHEADEAHILYC